MADNFTVVIPARFASTRLPGKPLRDIAGVPMIIRVWQQASHSNATAVVVATDHQGIADVCRDHGAQVVMTASDHPSGTDRLAEVARHLGLAADALVVNVQGDEPLVPPVVVDQVAGLLAAVPDAAAATLCTPVADLDELFDPNTVKVVLAANQLALYFSRAPVPWARDAFAGGKPSGTLPDAKAPWLRHLGIYAYRAAVLQEFVSWPASALEQTEALEQLRLLENGRAIAVAQACVPVPGGVDTPADLARVAALLSNNGA